jgi:MFS family permease
MVITDFSWFAFWSLLAGFSTYSRCRIFFDICRAMQGIGPAFLLLNSIAILGRAYKPGRRKEMVFSIFGATAPTGFFWGLFSRVCWRRKLGGLGVIDLWDCVVVPGGV